MNGIVALVIWRKFVVSRASAATYNLALQQQLAMPDRQSIRPQLQDRDRCVLDYAEAVRPCEYRHLTGKYVQEHELVDA